MVNRACEFQISSAARHGFYVMLPAGERMYVNPVLCAGTLEECLSYIRDNIAIPMQSTECEADDES